MVTGNHLGTLTSRCCNFQLRGSLETSGHAFDISLKRFSHFFEVKKHHTRVTAALSNNMITIRPLFCEAYKASEVTSIRFPPPTQVLSFFGGRLDTYRESQPAGLVGNKTRALASAFGALGSSAYEGLGRSASKG